jgi:DNA replication protein DnaC
VTAAYWAGLRAEVQERLDHPTPEEIQKLLAATRLPQRTLPGLRDLQETDENRDALTAVRRYVQEWGQQPGRGLYLWGPVGTGKSAFLQAAGFDLARRSGAHFHPERPDYPALQNPRVRVRFWAVADLFAEIKRGFDGPSAYDPADVEQCELLVLDDLGKTLTTPWSLTELFRLVDLRYREQRATCYTSNYAPEELADRMLARVGDDHGADVVAMFDRIFDTCEVLEISGASWRGRA